MYKKVFIIYFLISLSLFSQYITTYDYDNLKKTGSFAVTIGTSNNESCTGFEQTEDGGYILTGGEKLIKLDEFGDISWERSNFTCSYGGQSYILGLTEVKQKLDRGFIITGSFNPYFGGKVAVLLETDSIGIAVKQTKDFSKDGETYTTYKCLRTTKDEGCLLIEYSSVLNITYFSIRKLGGVNSFTLDFGMTGVSYLCETDDNGFSCLNDYGMQKYDSLGALEFTNEEIHGSRINSTEDGGYIVANKIIEYIAGSWRYNFELIKTDSIGNTLWSKTYGGFQSEFCFSVEQTIDKGYFITGTTNSFGAGGDDIWIIKTDENGEIIWDKTFGGPANESVFCGQQTSDGGYAIGGTTASFGAGGSDIWVIKTDETGTLIDESPIPSSTKLYQNYPNPFNPVTKISFSIPSKQDVKLSVYNSNGQLVKELANKKFTAGNNSIEFSGEEFNSGIYFYRLETASTKLTKKMLLIK